MNCLRNPEFYYWHLLILGKKISEGQTKNEKKNTASDKKKKKQIIKEHMYYGREKRIKRNEIREKRMYLFLEMLISLSRWT